MGETLAVYLVISGRIISIMALLLIMTLMMGRRQMGELPVFDFIVAITIGAIAGADIADPKIEHLPTAYAIIFLAMLQIIYSKMILHHRWFGQKTTFEPVVVIQNGKILNQSLKKIRYSVDTVLMMLREKEIFDLGEVEFALIEPNGKLTALKKTQYAPVIPKDLKIATPYRGIPLTLIVEGKVLEENLSKSRLTPNWLNQKLQDLGITSQEKVFYSSLNTESELYVSLYDNNINQIYDVRH